MKVFSLLHRVLLRFWPYKRLILLLGLDSYKYKKYYKTLSYESTEGVSCGEVDGYEGEGEFEKIVHLVGNLSEIVPEPGAVLDIGCGTGRYLKQMGEVWPGAHLEGIDISQEIVEKFACKQLPGVLFHVMDIETNQFFHTENAGKFDLVCMIGIIQILSLKKISGILEKVGILCKEGGYLYLQFNVETSEKKSSVGYKRYSIEELGSLLSRHGFQVVKADRTDILKDYAYIVAKK
ncbi:MAG: class I SAM-dependent methyltransferase [bacterium]|nr:class I SAM-dependent methyltransferase [bacterium]